MEIYVRSGANHREQRADTTSPISLSKIYKKVKKKTLIIKRTCQDEKETDGLISHVIYVSENDLRHKRYNNRNKTISVG